MSSTRTTNTERLLWLLLLMFFGIFAFEAGFFYLSCVDPGFHIRTGELVWQTGVIPSRNTFSSISPDAPWLLHQWLPATAIYLIWKSAGIDGLIIAKALLGALLFIVVYATAANESSAPGRKFMAFWVATLAVLLARPRLLERPYLVSALLFSIVLYADLKHYSRRSWHFAGIPLIMALWSNIHMGVIVGYQLLFLLRLGKWMEWYLSRRGTTASHAAKTPAPLMETTSLIASVLLSCLAVSLINPSGLKVLAAPVIYYLDPYWKNVAEFLPPPPGLGRWLLWFLCSMTAALQLMNRRVRDLPLTLVFVFFAWLAFRSQRGALFFSIASAPLLSRLLSAHFSEWPTKSYIIHCICLPAAWVLLTFTAFMPDQTFRYGIGINRRYHPLELFAFILSKFPQQNFYNDMQYGGPILLYLYPDFRPFVDGRGEAYPLDFWKNTYEPVSQGINALEYFNAHKLTGAILWNPVGTSRPLTDVLLKDQEWALAAFDDNTTIFLKRTPENSEVLSEFEIRQFDPTSNEFNIAPDNLAAALAEAATGAELAPQSVYWKTARAKTLLLSGSYAHSEAIYRELLTLGGNSYAHLKDRAYCLYMMGERKSAAEIFTELTLLPEADGYPWYMLAVIAIDEGQISTALNYITQAVCLSPQHQAYSEIKARLADQLKPGP